LFLLRCTPRPCRAHSPDGHAEGRIAPYGPERHASHGAHHAALHGRLLGLRAACHSEAHSQDCCRQNLLSTLAWPCLREEPELRFDGRLVHDCGCACAQRMKAAMDAFSRGRGIRGTDEGLGVRARESGEIVLVGAHEKAVTEVKGFLVARIVGGDRAEVEETPGRLDLEVLPR